MNNGFFRNTADNINLTQFIYEDKEDSTIRKRDADSVVQYRGRHAQQTAAGPRPADQETRNGRSYVPYIRRGARKAGDVDRTLHRDTRPSTGSL